MSRLTPIIISLSYNGASINKRLGAVRMGFRVPRPVTAGWRVSLQPAYQDAEDVVHNTAGVTASGLRIAGHLGMGRSKGRLADVPGGSSVDLSSGSWLSATSTVPLYPGVEYLLEFWFTTPAEVRVAGGSAVHWHSDSMTALDTRDGTRWGFDNIGPMNATILTDDGTDYPLIAVFGDSNTAGTASGFRWMDTFAQISNERDARAHLIPLGYTGEKLDEYNRATPKITRMLDLVNAAASTTEKYAGALINLGINDINVQYTLGASSLLADLDGLVTRVRTVTRTGGPVYVVTIPPMGYNPASSDTTVQQREAVRVAYNEAVRSGAHGDGVVDLDTVLRDPVTTHALRNEYRHLDQIHYTRQGHEAIVPALDSLITAAIA